MLRKIKCYFNTELKNKLLIVFLWLVALGYSIYFIYLIIYL